MKFLAICGSLRAASSNLLLLKGLAALAPAEVSVSFFDGFAQLPHFNPDLDAQAPPDPWRIGESYWPSLMGW